MIVNGVSGALKPSIGIVGMNDDHGPRCSALDVPTCKTKLAMFILWALRITTRAAGRKKGFVISAQTPDADCAYRAFQNSRAALQIIAPHLEEPSGIGR